MKQLSTTRTAVAATRAISLHGLRDVGEVVRGDPGRDDVEAAVGEGKVLGTADDVRLHARAPGRS